MNIGDTLATANITSGGTRLILNVLPGVISVLTKPQNNSIPLGIISYTPDNFAQAERNFAKEAGLRVFDTPNKVLDWVQTIAT